MSAPRIVVVGSSIVDMVVRAPRLPTKGETRPGTAFLSGFGGKGANQAVMAARLGAAVTMVTRLGDDAFGRDYLANFRAERINTSHASISTTTATGVASIWVEEHSGANQIIVVLGANDELSTRDVIAAGSAISDASVVLAQWEVPLDVVTLAFSMARAAGVTTVFNPAPARGELADELIALCDYICPNEHEAAELTGIAVGSVDQAFAAGRALRARGARAAIVTLGERGAVLVDANGARHVPVFAVPAVDSTGAGDAFLGSFACYIAGGVGAIEAMERASRAAAISVQRHGAQASFPTAAELA